MTQGHALSTSITHVILPSGQRKTVIPTQQANGEAYWAFRGLKTSSFVTKNMRLAMILARYFFTFFLNADYRSVLNFQN
jgi:hypothetical protein